MGQMESMGTLEDVSNNVEEFGLIINTPDRIKIANAGKNIIWIIRRILNKYEFLNDESYKPSSYCYVFKLRGYPFSSGHFGSEEMSVMCKVVLCEILNALHESRILPYVSSDLSLFTDQSTVLFRRERKSVSMGKYACLAPSGTDGLLIVDFPLEVREELLNTIQCSWGFENEPKISDNGRVVKLVLDGHPWGDENTGMRATRIRIMILNIFSTLKLANYNYIININTKGTSDCLFFKHDPHGKAQLKSKFLMYLSKNNRIRFIRAPESVTNMMRGTLNKCWKGGISRERIYNDAVEFSLTGSPWWSNENESIQARTLLCRIFELCHRWGYKCIATLSISRRGDDKSAFIFEGDLHVEFSSYMSIKWTCLAFCGEKHMRLIGLHAEVLSIIEESMSVLLKDRGIRGLDMHLWRIKGSPFSGFSNKASEVFTMALLAFYDLMKKKGWCLVSSADISSKYILIRRKRKSEDSHSWFFTKIIS